VETNTAPKAGFHDFRISRRGVAKHMGEPRSRCISGVNTPFDIPTLYGEHRKTTLPMQFGGAGARFNNSSKPRTSNIKRDYVKVGPARRIMDQQIGLVAGPMYNKSQIPKQLKFIKSGTLLQNHWWRHDTGAPMRKAHQLSWGPGPCWGKRNDLAKIHETTATAEGDAVRLEQQ
jgi:hypothetical protein